MNEYKEMIDDLYKKAYDKSLPTEERNEAKGKLKALQDAFNKVAEKSGMKGIDFSLGEES